MNGFSLGFLVLEAVPGETWASAMRQDRCSRSRASARQRAPLHLRSLARAVCGSGAGGPDMTRTVGLNRHCSQLNSLLATCYMNLSLQKQTHLVDGRPQVSSNGMVPCFCGSKPQLFEWLGEPGRGCAWTTSCSRRMSHSGHGRAGPWCCLIRASTSPVSGDCIAFVDGGNWLGHHPLPAAQKGSGGRCEPVPDPGSFPHTRTPSCALTSALQQASRWQSWPMADVCHLGGQLGRPGAVCAYQGSGPQMEGWCQWCILLERGPQGWAL